MKLRSLELHGFKSFADRTTLEFREGVTAVVGSNGCGKSNIADAVRWVLGEQRASAIRGSKMEEVIFQGAARRRPLNFAEVSLLFENDQGRVPIPQTEFIVSRKVFREGGSEYSMNRTPCRLREIHHLLRDTGLGSNAYAVIESGMIETLLSDRAEERRLIFEEAAGIGRYKDSRQAAVRRLDSAEADLARLGDLIAEVETKVRVLARQKRRAERYSELRARRLALEVWLAMAELEGLRSALAQAERRRSELEEGERVAAGRRATAELRAEERRVEQATLSGRRASVAAALDETRRDLHERERELLIADERGSHATMRLAQLDRERAEIGSAGAALAREIAERHAEASRHRETLADLRSRLEERSERNRELRTSVSSARAATDAAGARARELAREIAGDEGERNATERRRQELAERAAELKGQEERLRAEVTDLARESESWEVGVGETRARMALAVQTAELARDQIGVYRGREQEAVDALRAAEDRLSRLIALVDARAAVEQSYSDFAPAVAALLAARGKLTGVHAPLADYIAEEAGDVSAVEAYLGPLLQAVVVDDLAAARRVRAWFDEECSGEGSLWLLPLDALNGARSGADWARLLLADMVAVDDPLREHRSGVTRVGPGGELVDGRGVIRLGGRGVRQGILSRREELVRLRADREEALRSRDHALAGLGARRTALTEADEHAHAADELRRAAEAELRRVEGDRAAHQHHHRRLQRDLDQVAQTLGTLIAAAEGAARRSDELNARLAARGAALEEATDTEATSRAGLLDLEERWEEARDEEAELRVAVARAEADLREAETRSRAATGASAAATARLGAIGAEEGELRETLVGLSGVRTRAGSELDALFRRSDERTSELGALDAELTAVQAAATEWVEQARTSRRIEAQAAAERHQVELSLADLRSRTERTMERLEVEWGRPWDALVESAGSPDEGSIERWRSERRDAVSQLDSLGPVNMLSVEEHAEEERRLAFLTEQRSDLVAARDDLVSAIRQINRTAREMFVTTFDAVRANFHRVFQSLFQGGECDLWLDNPDDPLESAVEIHASPGGKRTQRIHLLSGGERTLTALALVFALYLVKPAPFCVLDEVDAPLDETNVGRFIQLLQDFKADTQFIVITHHPRTMEAADWVYGVTMQEPGVSSIVAVELLGAWQTEDRVA